MAVFAPRKLTTTPAGQNVQDYGYNNTNNAATSSRAIQSCESAVDRRLTEQVSSGSEWGPWILMTASARVAVYGNATVTDQNRRQQVVDFSCSMNSRDGTVTSVDVIPRR